VPEQQSSRHLPVTSSVFDAPFTTEIYPFGVGGLNLKDQFDLIPVGQFPRLTNLTHSQDRGLTARPGLTSLATGGTAHHSVRRLHDPEAGTDTRIWGTDQDLRRGLSGALSVIDSGYSGDPLYLVPHRPPLSGDPWMFVADRSRMRKVRADGLDLQIGLPAPSAAPTVVPGNLYTTGIAAFDATDGTQAVNWIPTAGQDRSEPPIPTGLPLIQDTVGLSGSAVAFTTTPGAVVNGYNSWGGIAKAIDLSVLQGGAVQASDDDLLHTWLNMSHPHLIEELRIYLVCSAAFAPTILPGTDHLGRNIDAYVKSFRQNDLAQFIQAREAQVDAAETARIRALRDQSLADTAETQGFQGPTARTTVTSGVRQTLARRDPARTISEQAQAGAEEWVEFGVVGVPIRRGDFQRIGSTVGRDWNTVTGIIIYLSTSDPAQVAIRLDDFFLYGGSGADSTEPGAQPYDYRYTHYDTRTGAEGNPSPVMTEANFLDAARREIFITPAAPFGDSAVRQRIYRRGGSLIDDWYFVGVTSADGVLFADTLTDDAIVAAGTVNLDHFQPVPTINDAGATVLAENVPVLFGPANGLLFALGDRFRPGHLYWCIPDEPDHWPAESNLEVCPPSEELMAGLMYGSQPLCFSRERLYAIYPNLSGTVEVTVTTTACRRGLVSRWAWTIGLGGIYGVAKDGIFVTGGGQEEIMSQEIQRLFRGETWNGYSPVNFSFPTAIRLSIHQDTLYFQYQGTDGSRHVLAYSLLYKFWSDYDFAIDTAYLLPDDDSPIASLLVGGLTTGASYTHDGFSDAGTAIICTVRTGTWDLGRPREDKLLGDQILDVDLQGVTNATLRNRLNNETIVNGLQALDVTTGRRRYILDSFGATPPDTTPQRARNISTEITWSSATVRPTLYFLGQSIIQEPDVTINRVTQWDDLGHPDESYLTGVTFDCDTGNVARTIIIERDFGGVISTVATLSVTANGRHKLKFSWPAVPAHKVRIRPTGECLAWILWRADWIALPEPPRIARWDIHFEADGDQYYTGVDLYCDTNGLEKRIVITVDNVQLQNTHGGLNLAYWPITTNGRQWVHLTLPWGRGHVFHFTASDDNPGLLYKHKWYLDAEPTELQNWAQNFSIYGSRADKYLKAIIFECDTFNQSKSVQVEVDGTIAETLSVVANGRRVVQIALAEQKLGRVWRMFPVDGNPGRLYSAQPVFDEEPLALDRWESQESTHDQHGFLLPIEAQVTLKSTKDVVLTLFIHVNQTGTVLSQEYLIPPTVGIKQKCFVPFKARKGVLIKYLLTSEDPFWLYQEESSVVILPWGSDQPIVVRPFGNADVDRTRSMIISSIAAGRSGGGTS